MQIDYLAHHHEHLATLAAWHHAQWGHLHPGETVEGRRRRLREQAQESGIPLVVVALEEEQPLGSASIVAHDMDSHLEWTPWLASVFVASPFRGRGIGTALVERIEDEARRMDVDMLYLYTPDRTTFYQRLGWQPLSRETYRGEAVTVMRKALHETQE
jgi:GNAT superfamily N-acetyltransferase